MGNKDSHWSLLLFISLGCFKINNRFLKKLKIEQPCDPTTPLPGIKLKDLKERAALPHSVQLYPPRPRLGNNLSVHQQMNKEMIHVCTHAYTGLLFSLKRGNPDICDHVDKPGRHYARQTKPLTEDKYATYMKNLKQSNS